MRTLHEKGAQVFFVSISLPPEITGMGSFAEKDEKRYDKEGGEESE
ncbi:MAG: hypothetical protein ACK4G3_00320 [bacterium]